MALVIFCVALVAAMRLRRSLRLAMSGERPGVGLDRALELGAGGVVEIARGADRLQNIRVIGAYGGQQALLERAHPVDRERIEIAVDAGVDDDDLLLHLERRELRLLQELGQAGAAIEQALGGGVEIGAELRERRHLAVLRQDRKSTRLNS